MVYYFATEVVFFNTAITLLSHLPTPHRIVLGCTSLILVVSLILSDNSSAVPVSPGQFRSTLDLKLQTTDVSASEELSESSGKKIKDSDPEIGYVVQKGDTLSPF